MLVNAGKKIIDMLITTKDVIAKNQEFIDMEDVKASIIGKGVKNG